MSYSFIEKNNTNSYLSISSTQGAACVDGIHNITLANDLVTVRGIPAHSITIYTDGDGYILSDPLRRKITTLSLNERGYGFAQLCRNSDSSYAPLKVTAYDTVWDKEPVSPLASYDTYRRGPGRFHAINYTSGALTVDGSYCSIFLYINNIIPGKKTIITQVNVNPMSMDLEILNPNYNGAINLESDSSVSIDIFSRSSGKKRVYISLDESPDGEFLVIDLIFNVTI